MMPPLPMVEQVWLALVERWQLASQNDPAAAEGLLAAVLRDGWFEHAAAMLAGEAEPVDAGAFKTPDALKCEMALLAHSGMFDPDWYLDGNPDVAAHAIDPLWHFCRYGWRELRNPSPEFDVWYYWVTWLDPRAERINPLLHHVLTTRAAQVPTVPPSVATHVPPCLVGGGKPPRRVCLVAGYDVDGVVDDYVVALVRELARHADVYYMADNVMQPGELDKLTPYTNARRAFHHGAYDFGSWSTLARDVIGWDAIATYDELLLINDSNYLLRPLDALFDKMDRRPCDWWGMQLTKRNFPDDDDEPWIMPTEQVCEHLLPERESACINSLHISSYCIAFRQPVLRDPGFRDRLDAVVTQARKSDVILRYEIGLSRWLMARGYIFDTFVPGLHPYHPVYTREHFDLIRDGFPFLKRLLLSENPLDVPDLVDWKARITELAPSADVAMFERNLLRVAPDDRLQRSFAIHANAAGEAEVPTLLAGQEFIQADTHTPVFDHWWAFPVCAYDHGFSGNLRAVFEEVRDDPSIKKIILTRSKRVAMDGANLVVAPLESPEGQHYLLRAGYIFVKHGPRINTHGLPLSPRHHRFINLWHGIPLKRFGPAATHIDRLQWVMEENRRCRAVICSSALDRLAMTAAFYPLPYEHLWPTGLPRNDFILRAFEQLPHDFREQEAQLRQETGDRRLVLFAPTFRDGQQEATYQFSDEELAWLADWQQRHHVVLGLREHMADRSQSYRNQLKQLNVLDLSSRHYPNIEVLYRVGAALVSDYSSCLVDYLLTGRPVVSFAYDYAHYNDSERGLFYDLERVLPGPVCRDFAQLRVALDGLFKQPTAFSRRHYESLRRRFFDHLDDRNAWRVVKQVKQLHTTSSRPATA